MAQLERNRYRSAFTEFSVAVMNFRFPLWKGTYEHIRSAAESCRMQIQMRIQLNQDDIRRMIITILKYIGNCVFVIVCILNCWKAMLAFLSTPSPFAIILSGSMEPTMRRGDLLILTIPMKYEAGDIVVFSLPHRPVPVVHRITNMHAKVMNARNHDNYIEKFCRSTGINTLDYLKYIEERKYDSWFPLPKEIYSGETSIKGSEAEDTIKWSRGKKITLEEEEAKKTLNDNFGNEFSDLETRKVETGFENKILYSNASETGDEEISADYTSESESDYQIYDHIFEEDIYDKLDLSEYNIEVIMAKKNSQLKKLWQHLQLVMNPPIKIDNVLYYPSNECVELLEQEMKIQNRQKVSLFPIVGIELLGDNMQSVYLTKGDANKSLDKNIIITSHHDEYEAKKNSLMNHRKTILDNHSSLLKKQNFNFEQDVYASLHAAEEDNYYSTSHVKVDKNSDIPLFYMQRQYIIGNGFLYVPYIGYISLILHENEYLQYFAIGLLFLVLYLIPC